MPRPSWSGFLRFNLISVPVKGYNAAASGGGRIGFHLLHKSCHSRIKYKKVCPIHGEVADDEIVSGYEAAKGEYVVVGKDERAELKVEDEKTISVDTFVPPDAIDLVYFSGRNYYLVPDGKVAQKPYAVLLESMRAEERVAVAQVVFAGRAQLAVVRPAEGILAMSLLHFASEVKPAADFSDEVQGGAVTAQEKKLAETLIDAATAKSFDLAEYKDAYGSRLAKLVEGKSKTAKRSKAHEEAPAVINLMDALRQSLARTKKGAAARKSHSKAVRRATTRRKTG